MGDLFKIGWTFRLFVLYPIHFTVISAAIFKVSFLIADDILSEISGNESIQSIEISITFM